MAAQAIDLHEELAEAKVGKFHWRLGAIMGLLTLFDGYDTFNPAYVIHYVAKPWGLQAGQAGLLISSGLVGFLLGAAIRHHCRSARPPRHPARRLVDHHYLHPAHRDFGGLVPLLLHPAAPDRHRTRRAAAARDHLHQRAGAASRREYFALWGVALGWALGGTLAGVAGVFATPIFAGHRCTGSARCRFCSCRSCT